MNTIKKPPLGLRPKWICDEARRREIIDAMKRYSNSNMPIPIEWIDELDSITDIHHGTKIQELDRLWRIRLNDQGV